MLFEDKARVLYTRNPLEEVICQLRFPTILRITSEPPAKFQEAIRQQFPVLNERRDSPIKGLPAELRAIFPTELLGGASSVAFDFVSEDESLTASLTKDFLALSARKYERWEDFRKVLLDVWGAVCQEYKPAFISRVGLRYRNVIKPSQRSS